MRKAVKNPRIWAALLAATALHALLLLLPARQSPPPDRGATLELDLTAHAPATLPAPEARTEPAPLAEPPAPAEEVAELAEAAPPQVAPVAVEPEPAPSPVPVQRVYNKDVILARQYITEEPVIDRIFSRPLERPAAPQVDFRIPERTSMLAMLDRPMQDLPFAYEPGLVYFAYDPGVRGDLQRFWDVITPEFGWRTNNGTEVRCVLLLVVIGCGWK